MKPDTDHRWREDIGAYVLGRLPADETAELEAHLRSCSECQRDVRELTPIAAVLPAGDPSLLDAPVAPPHGLEDRVVQAVASSRTRVVPISRRSFSRRSILAVAAAFVVALGAIAYVAVRPSTAPAPVPNVEAIRFRVVPEGATADGQLVSRGDTIEIRLQVRALPPGAYRMSVTGRDGRTISSNEFRTTGIGSWNGARELAIARSEALTLAVHQIEGRAELIADISAPTS